MTIIRITTDINRFTIAVIDMITDIRQWTITLIQLKTDNIRWHKKIAQMSTNNNYLAVNERCAEKIIQIITGIRVTMRYHNTPDDNRQKTMSYYTHLDGNRQMTICHHTIIQMTTDTRQCTIIINKRFPLWRKVVSKTLRRRWLC